LYNLSLNIATLSGTMLGPLLADMSGLREAMFIVAGIRFLVGWLWSAGADPDFLH
jgi:hypothetical protein